MASNDEHPPALMMCAKVMLMLDAIENHGSKMPPEAAEHLASAKESLVRSRDALEKFLGIAKMATILRALNPSRQ